MPFIAAASKIDLPYKTEQELAKKQALEMFSTNFPEANRLIFAFDNTEIMLIR
jgi:alkylresorcinol/alkylpyrone synthase